MGPLLGSRETHGDTPYIFMDGALGMDSVTEEGEKVVSIEDAWKKTCQDMEQIFPRKTVQGWFLCRGPGCTLSPLNYWCQHSQYLTDKNQLMYLNCGLEGEESVYITPSDDFYKLHGYGVYYERSQMTQDYIIQRKDAPRAEIKVDDKAVHDSGQRTNERKHEVGRHRNIVSALSDFCSALAVIVLAGDVAVFNNYQRIYQMENAIALVMPDGSVKNEPLAFSRERPGIAENSSSKRWSAVDEPGYMIEEAAGKVYPIAAPVAGSGEEQSSEVKPETMPMAEISTLDGTAGEEAERETVGAAKAEGAGGMSAELGTTKVRVAGAENPGTGIDGTRAGGTTTAAGDGSDQASFGQVDPAKPSDDTSPTEETVLPPTGDRDGSAEAVSAVNYSVYTVVGGEILYDIRFKLYHNLKHIDEICRVNTLTDENSTYAGQKLFVP